MNTSRKEIGSEFWDVPIAKKRNELFSESTQWYLSGHSALQAIITELGTAKTVSLPSWCCESMIKPFADAGFRIRFYSVFYNQGVKQEINFDSEVLFLIDYFGYTSNAPDLSGYKGVVVRDVTHSLFSHTFDDADYYFGSLRKWCGVWTGGYAWASDEHNLFIENTDEFGYTQLREKAMQLKNRYIHGWGITDKKYLEIYEEAEECLEKAGIAPAAYRDVILAQNMDAEFISSRRRTNAEVLRRAFPDWLMFPGLSATDTPMFVPVLVPGGKRDALRKYLIRNEIYCPVHWPVSKYHKLDERTDYIYKNELSLVCDQRYTAEDMDRMVKTIKMFMED